MVRRERARKAEARFSLGGIVAVCAVLCVVGWDGRRRRSGRVVVVVVSSNRKPGSFHPPNSPCPSRAVLEKMKTIPVFSRSWVWSSGASYSFSKAGLCFLTFVTTPTLQLHNPPPRQTSTTSEDWRYLPSSHTAKLCVCVCVTPTNRPTTLVKMSGSQLGWTCNSGRGIGSREQQFLQVSPYCPPSELFLFLLFESCDTAYVVWLL